MVIVFHLDLPLPGGFVGVDIFFVISGFVITAMLQREWNLNNRISVRNFFARRFWRLTPALALVVTSTFVIGGCVVSAYGPSRLMMLTGFGAVTLSANAVIAKFTGGYFDIAADKNPLLNTWSLSVEEQFYIGFLFILIFAWGVSAKLKKTRNGTLAIVLMFFLASLILALLSQPSYPLEKSSWLFHFYGPINRAWEFAAGAIIALVGSTKPQMFCRFSNFQGFLGFFLVGYSAFFISEEVAWPSAYTLIPVLGTALIITAGQGAGSKINDLLARNIPVFIGDRSYSLYLWHWPVIVIAGYFSVNRPTQVLVVLLISVLLTLATYRWVESPLRKSRPKTKFSVSALVAAVLLTPIVAGAGLYVANSKGFWSDNLREQKQALAERHAADKNGCNKKISYLHRDSKDCSWNLEAAGTPIYLVGDSNAAHYSDGFIQAARQTNHPLVTAIGAGCPFLLVPYQQPDRNVYLDGNHKACSTFSQETFTWLKSQPRGLVIISNSESYETVSDNRVVAKSGTTLVNQYAQFLEKSTGKLAAEGFKVAVVLGPPHFDPRAQAFPGKYEWDPAKCTLRSQMTNTCRGAMPLDIADNLQSSLKSSLLQISQSKKVHLIDISRFFCNAHECPTQNDRLQIYRDRLHTTVDADLELIPTFVAEIQKILP